MISDGVEVAEFLGSYLGQEKIILVGHSWRSFLGISMVRRRPNLFSAYVGTGQMVNKKRNEEVNYERQSMQAEASQNFAALAGFAPARPASVQSRGLKNIAAMG
jgi:pimeloyl-ACP methyl ester carboxylesterase